MTKGFFNYMSAESQSSLFRNGKVVTRRDINGNDSGSEGIKLKKHKINVLDARKCLKKDKISLNSSGFEIQKSKIASEAIDFFNSEQITKSYYSHSAGIIKESTGAKDVFAFDHNIRSATGKKIKKSLSGGQQVQGPAHIVHGDYTLRSAPDRIRQLSKLPSKNDTLKKVIGHEKSLLTQDQVEEIFAGRRFAIVNLWRNISSKPVEINPIALCDASTVSAEDLVVFEIHYSDRIGENYFSKHNRKHKWYFYPKMTSDEALLIKQWDSHGKLASTNGNSSDSNLMSEPCTFSFHSAFDDPLVRADAPDRWSMEVRCVVIY